MPGVRRGSLTHGADNDARSTGTSSAGKRSSAARTYPALQRAIGLRREGEATINDVATTAVEHKSGGESLHSGVAVQVGRHLGADFTRVRVHSDPLAQQATAAIGARAFAYR